MLIKSCWLSDSCLQGGLLYFMYVVLAVRSISRAYQQVNSRPCEKANASTVYAAWGDIEIVYKGQKYKLRWSVTFYVSISLAKKRKWFCISFSLFWLGWKTERR